MRIVTDRILRALVTGASSGLGESFARQLATRGVELVLVARDRGRLAALAASLPVDVEVLVADLTDTGERAAVEARLSAVERPVDLLVNNAGMGAYGAVAEVASETHESMIALNVTGIVRLTRAVMPRLVARGAGGIIQLGSITAYQPNPYAATYGATKAFVHSFTRAVQRELVGTGVHMMLLAPGSTRTHFHERAGGDRDRLPDFVSAEADDVVTKALDDFARRRATSSPGGFSRALTVGTVLAPAAVSGRISGAAHRHLAARP